MKKVVIVLISLYISILSHAQVTGLQGLGTTEDPYCIYTIEELIWMRNQVNSTNVDTCTAYYNKAYKLMNDLDFTGQDDWIPIGTGNYYECFSGVFDGNCKVIRNIKIGSPTLRANRDCAGFFRELSYAYVINLGIEWSSIYTIKFCAYAGGICYSSNGTSKIINCYTTGPIDIDSGYWAYCGGIVALNSGEIINCYSTCSVTATVTTSSIGCGGIVGENRGIIKNCYSSGKVCAITPAGSTANNINSGGIAGTSGGATIENSIALNSQIISTNSYNVSRAYVRRIAYGTTGVYLNNYASNSISVKRGSTLSSLSTVTSFSGTENGTTISSQLPLNILNNWVSTNPTTTIKYGTIPIDLRTWKVDGSINGGLPVFDLTTVNNLTVHKNSNANIYSIQSHIIVEGDNLNKIMIYNLYGQLIRQCNPISNKTDIAISNGGVYVVLVLDENSNIIVREKVLIK